MKISRRVALWVIGGACVCLLGMYSSIGHAQDGEVVDADSLLMRKSASKASTQVPSKEGTINMRKGLSRDQEAMLKAHVVLEDALAAAKAENEDDAMLAKKVKLAKEMHNIRPTREQVDSAIRRAASKLSEYERANFMSAMKSMLNYNAIERISIDAMVETYSHKELESMVGYFSKPEAMSASKKIRPWAQRVQPEIARMIDRAMMRIRTGQ